jgi:hypothetical protein
MKTLKESLLGNLEDNYLKGDKMLKEHESAINELKYIHKKLIDFSPNNIVPWYTGGSGKLAGEGYRLAMFVKSPKLLKFFKLQGKNIFFSVTLDYAMKQWDLSIILTSASKPTINNRYQTMTTNHDKKIICYHLKDSTIKDVKSEYSPEEIITKYLAPMFESEENFIEYIVKPSIDSTSIIVSQPTLNNI